MKVIVLFDRMKSADRERMIDRFILIDPDALVMLTAIRKKMLIESQSQ